MSTDVQVDPAMLTSGFIRKIEQGMIKEAEVSASSYIRKVMREEGFLRKILTPIQITDDQLDRDVNTDKPKVIVDKEPDSKATYIPFRGKADNRYYSGSKFDVFFDVIESDHFHKDIFELKTYNNDIRQIIKDNVVKDIQTTEDGRFIQLVNTLVSGTAQEVSISGGLTSPNLAEAAKVLARVKLPNGCMLMNSSTEKEILKFPATSIGDTVASKRHLDGFQEGKVHGIRTLVTIKRDLVPDNVVYFFAPEEFLGKFFVLQDATFYIEHKGHNVMFYTYESIGVGIANVNAVAKVTFA
jgi:hypothetical protein